MKLIKSRDRVKKYGEVYTPERIVSAMCDECEDEGEDAFSIITKIWLEPACGNGNFLAEIFKRKLDACETPLDGAVALDSLYGIDILPDNVAEARARLKAMYESSFGQGGSTYIEEILDTHIVCGNFLTGIGTNGKEIWFLSKEGVQT